ncbi:hypothetical protein BT96DRAFT_1005840 [Gymnopus androsaceus JB14]|uniref:Uncharacterized protein n=1 Tax=Gymnopus androsaceus JB14 TaxID=1447944 RepID=A0A6A4GNE1_9AGAR|nr:hypothetical protein BT96DRAFT_1005840 [Gymnopus androsaceus JB14]
MKLRLSSLVPLLMWRMLLLLSDISHLSFWSGSNTPSTLTPGSHSPSASPAPMDAFKLLRVAPAPAAAHTHRVIGSLSKTWTLPAAAPRQTQTPPSQSRDRDEVDKFFNCLEDSESDSSTAGLRSLASSYTYDSEHNKGYSLFAKALEAFDEDDEEQVSPQSLDVVFEEEEQGEEEEEEEEEDTQVDDDEEEDDNDMFGAGAGIMITVTPATEDNDDDEYPSPQIEDSDVEEQEDEEEWSEQVVQVSNSSAHFSSARKPVPLFNGEFDEDDNDVPFNFGHPLPLRLSTPPNNLPMSTPPRSTPSRSVRTPLPSTSSIPQPKSFINNFSSSSSTPVDSDSSFSSVSTSTSIIAPSFIPQPVPVSSVSFPSSSPSPMRKGPALRERPSGTVASFIRQPARKPPLMAAASKTRHNDSDSIPNVFRSMTNVNDGPCFSSSSNRHVPAHADSADSSSVRSISRFEASYSRSIEAEAGDGLTSLNSNSTLQSSPSLSSIMTSPKLSFLSGFIPRPWESASVPGAVPVTKTKSNPTSRVYVSRARQLERLRLRFQHDGSRLFSEDVCQRCDGAVVYL